MRHQDRLRDYLRRHQLGAQVGTQLLQALVRAEPPARAERLRPLVPEFEEECEVLALLRRVTGTRARRDWVSAQLVAAWLRLERRAAAPASQLEWLALTVEGKRRLWSLLASLSRMDPRLACADYVRLQRLARAQLELLEPLRLQEAVGAFTEPSSRRPRLWAVPASA